MIVYRIKKIIAVIGTSRLIIGSFLLVLIITAVVVNIKLTTLIRDCLIRIGMNGLFVLAMLPSIQGGAGLNFGLPVGIVCGLVGGVISLNLSLTGFSGIAIAIVIAIPLAATAGFAYGLILNRVKGSEMMVGNYLAFSVVSLFSIIWMVFPVSNPSIVWPMTGRGVRTTITLTGSYSGTLDNFLAFEIVPGLIFPTGLFLIFALGCVLVYIFSKSRTGMSMLFSGMNPGFAATIGISEDKMRVLGNIISSVLAAVGIVVYAQSYGFYQLYSAPLMMAFPSIAAILIGGATPRKATILHVLIGTTIYQSLLTIAMPVANKLVASGGLSEIARVLVSNGIILYALTKINSERQNGK